MRRPRPVSVLLGLALAACATSPGYRPSAVTVPPAFRETARDTTTQAPLPPAAVAPDTAVPVVPPDSERTVRAVDQATYWRALGATTLDRLMGELLRANLDVRSALARVRGARAPRAPRPPWIWRPPSPW